jgi:maltose alpha-D-glucosyltransferase/alpha-amylase
MPSRFEDAIESTVRAVRHSRPFRTWIRSLRWCGDSIHFTTELAVTDHARLAESGSEVIVWFLLRAKDRGRGARPVHLPLSIALARLNPEAFELETDKSAFYILEAERRDGYARLLVDGFRQGRNVRTASGDSLTFCGEGVDSFRGVSPVPIVDTSNVLVRIATAHDAIIVKSYKFLDTSNREPEILARLHAHDFPHAARFVGEAFLGRGKDRVVLAIATEHVDGPDVFSWMRERWIQALDAKDSPGGQMDEACRSVAAGLGEATARLHETLVDRHPGPWRLEPFTAEDFRREYKEAMRSLAESLRRLGQLGRMPESPYADVARLARSHLLDLREGIENTVQILEANVGGPESVIHSDLHLAQVLRRSSDGRLLFIDFEGEPDRTPGQRARKLPPLRDVGSMVRSFAYVRHYIVRGHSQAAEAPLASPLDLGGLSAPQPDLIRRLTAWEAEAVDRFVSAYLDSSTLYRDLEKTEARRIVRGWAMEKALYELDYELKHRKENFMIPLEGIVTLAASSPGPR